MEGLKCDIRVNYSS